MNTVENFVYAVSGFVGRLNVALNDDGKKCNNREKRAAENCDHRHARGKYRDIENQDLRNFI
jgi:hypothetical protein